MSFEDRLPQQTQPSRLKHKSNTNPKHQATYLAAPLNMSQQQPKTRTTYLAAAWELLQYKSNNHTKRIKQHAWQHLGRCSNKHQTTNRRIKQHTWHHLGRCSNKNQTTNTIIKQASPALRRHHWNPKATPIFAQHQHHTKSNGRQHERACSLKSASGACT